jgi:hypothetical protein
MFFIIFPPAVNNPLYILSTAQQFVNEPQAFFSPTKTIVQHFAFMRTGASAPIPSSACARRRVPEKGGTPA